MYMNFLKDIGILNIEQGKGKVISIDLYHLFSNLDEEDKAYQILNVYFKENLTYIGMINLLKIWREDYSMFFSRAISSLRKDGGIPLAILEIPSLLEMLSSDLEKNIATEENKLYARIKGLVPKSSLLTADELYDYISYGLSFRSLTASELNKINYNKLDIQKIKLLTTSVDIIHEIKNQDYLK